MKERKACKIVVYQGWTSRESVDARIHLYVIHSRLQSKLEYWSELPDRFRFLKVDKSLKAGLRFSVNLARKMVVRNSRMIRHVWTLATIGILIV